MTIWILESAKKDLISGYRFYEGQAPGLGEYFLDTIFSDIDSLIIYSGIHPVRFDQYHCMFSKRFPYAIYYNIKDEVVFVEAILDCRQNPKSSEERLENK